MDEEELRLRCAHGQALIAEGQARRALCVYLNKARLAHAHRVLNDPASSFWQRIMAKATIRKIKKKL